MKRIEETISDTPKTYGLRAFLDYTYKHLKCIPYQIKPTRKIMWITCEEADMLERAKGKDETQD